MQTNDLEAIYRKVREEWDEDAFVKLHEHMEALLLRIARKEPGDQENLVAEVLLKITAEFKKKERTVWFKPVSCSHFEGKLCWKFSKKAIDAARKRKKEEEVVGNHGMGKDLPRGGQAKLRKEGRPLKTHGQDFRHDAKEKEKRQDLERDMAELKKHLIAEKTLKEEHFEIAELSNVLGLEDREIAERLNIPVSRVKRRLAEFGKAFKPAWKRVANWDTDGNIRPDPPS